MLYFMPSPADAIFGSSFQSNTAVSQRTRQFSGRFMKIIFLLLLSAFVLSAQDPSDDLQPQMPTRPLYTSLPAQPIGPNDLILITVYDVPQLSEAIRVSAEGTIRLPMISNELRIGGMMPAAIETSVAEALKKADLVLNPIVTVTVLEYQSRSITVAGAVKNPITFQATHPTSLLDALNRAGGLTSDAGQEILVTASAGDGSGKTERLQQRISTKSLIDQADPTVNLVLHGGEEIRVPSVGRIYVVGQVRNPGTFPLQNEHDTTVLQALALSGGLQEYASKQAYIYRHEAGPGAKNEIPISLKDIMSRKTADPHLQAQDILYIPMSSGSKLTAQAIEKIMLFGASAGASALIYGTMR